MPPLHICDHPLPNTPHPSDRAQTDQGCDSSSVGPCPRTYIPQSCDRPSKRKPNVKHIVDVFTACQRPKGKLHFLFAVMMSVLHVISAICR